MIPKYVENTEVFREFSSEEQEKHFGLNYKAVRSHIDTLYFFVKIAGDAVGTEDTGILSMLAEFKALKEEKKSDYQKKIGFYELSFEGTGFSIYEYRLSLPEMYDIFISSYIPNDDTPRIVIQLRTRSLVLRGPLKAIRESMEKVKEMLWAYGLRIGDVGINRVDYAYHTNLIQSPMKYFNDDRMKKSLRSSLRKYMKVGSIGEDITLETLSLGMRNSNNIFFRAYDKTREVVEKAYKSFFIEKWKEDGLISEYDYYVLMYAYERGSFVSGMYLGRMFWYLKYGKNDDRKAEFRKLIESCHVKSDNNNQLEKMLDGVLPKVTVIMNFEFQTKRKFYMDIHDVLKKIPVPDDCEPELQNLYKIILYRSKIQEYLTASTVCWVDDRKSEESKVLDWWKRIQRCEIESEGEYEPLVRKRDLGSDIKRTERRLKNTIAHLQILRNNSTEKKTFHEDASDVLCYLNDNDFYGFGLNPEGNEVILKEGDYSFIRDRKARQDKGLIESIRLKKEIDNQERIERLKLKKKFKKN